MKSAPSLGQDRQIQSGFVSYMVAVVFITWMTGMALTHAVL